METKKEVIVHSYIEKENSLIHPELSQLIYITVLLQYFMLYVSKINRQLSYTQTNIILVYLPLFVFSM